MKTIRSHKLPSRFALVAASALTSCLACAQQVDPPSLPSQSATPLMRTIVFVSDTHMGLGRTSNGRWSELEDFRWNGALKGFLDDLGERYANHVDLVVLGDFLELWQPYPEMTCTAPTPESGCTEAETLALAQFVIKAHERDFLVLDRFLSMGDNRMYIVPGNHDAALLTEPVWTATVAAFPSASQRINRVEGGVWISASRRTVAEHGHQIGKDANRYDQWPTVTTTIDGTTHLVRPWGELFVQTLFNDVEMEYPIIDNLSPESLGARYRLADRGLGKSAKDLARFAMFNLFETSRRQFARFLSADQTSEPEWDLEYARTQGYKLVVSSLPAEDEFAAMIEESSELGASIRNELDIEVAELPDDHLRQLCDHAAMQGRQVCLRSSLGATAQSLLNSKQAVVATHLMVRRVRYPAMTNFVYGHTHEYETPWIAKLRTGHEVTVANTGAFQRVIDAEGFERRRQERGLSASQALKGVALDDLPACYTFVVIEDEDMDMQLFRWHQPESAAVGIRVSESSPVCL